MEGPPDPFSIIFPPFFNNPTVVFSFGGPPSRTDSPSIPTTAVQTPTSTPSEATQRSIRPSSPLTQTVTKTEIGSISVTPTTVSHSSNATTIVLQATLTETSILPAHSPSGSDTPHPSFQEPPQPSNVVIGVTVAIVAAFIVVTTLVLVLLYRRRRAQYCHDEEMQPYTMDSPLTPSSSQSIWSYYDVKRNTMLSQATSTGPAQTQIPRTEAEPQTPISPSSSDHTPLIYHPTPVAPLDALVTQIAPRPRTREVDAGSLHHETYPHEYYEREGSAIVEPLPPAYEDLPPRRPPGLGLARGV